MRDSDAGMVLVRLSPLDTRHRPVFCKEPAPPCRLMQCAGFYPKVARVQPPPPKYVRLREGVGVEQEDPVSVAGDECGSR